MGSDPIASESTTGRRTSAWLPVVLCCLFIFLQSALPAPPVPGGLDLPGMDKAAHLCIYLILGALWARAYHLTLSLDSRFGLWLLATLCAALYGASDEVHQAFVAARSAEFADWLADLLGAGLGAALYLRSSRRRS